MDLAKVDQKLSELVQKRAKGRETANREEAAWKEPAQRRRERKRARIRAEWAEYFTALAESHRKLSEGYSAKADALREQPDERSKAS